MATVAIVGGGLAGLSAAHYLSKLAPLSATVKKIIVLEASERFGGWIRTIKLENGSLFESGPRTIRGTGQAAYNTLSLIEDLGLDMAMLPIGPEHVAARNRLIYHNNTFVPLPNKITEAFNSIRPLQVSPAGLVVSEFFKRRELHDDETIYNFVERRFGDDVAQMFVDPLVRGIFAGSIQELSVKSCFRQLYDYERTYGSVVMGALRAPKGPPPECESARIFKDNGWKMFSMDEGLEQLVRGLVEQLRHHEDRATIYTNKPVTDIQFTESGKAKVYSREEVFEVDHVIGACLSSALSPSLPAQHAELVDALNDIPAVSVAVVNLEFAGNILPYIAFGHLIPSFEPTPVLGIIYDSLLFEEHNTTQDLTSRATVMMGGAWFEQHFGPPEKADHEEIGIVAAEEMQAQLNFPLDPCTTLVHVHKNCIPQYVVGHSKNLQRIERYIDEHKLPLSLVGNSYRGVSINDVILDSRRQVEKYVKELKRGSGHDHSGEVYL